MPPVARKNHPEVVWQRNLPGTEFRSHTHACALHQQRIVSGNHNPSSVANWASSPDAQHTEKDETSACK